MAIIKLGPTVTGIRGTIGGITYSANGAGTYAKQWAKGPNPKTSRQNNQRAKLADQPAGWRSLTSAQQAAWDTFASLPAQDQTNSLGETYSISGFGWYVKVNVRLAVVGRTPRTDPPTNPYPSNPTITNLRAASTASGQQTRINYPSLQFAGFDLIIKIHFVPTVGQQVRATGFTLVVADTSPPVTTKNFQTECETAFGTILLNSFAFCEVFRQTHDGLRSSRTLVTDLANI